MLGIIVEASGNTGDLPNRILFKFGGFTALERVLNACISSYYAHRVILVMPSADRSLISGGMFNEGLASISSLSFAGRSVDTMFLGRQEDRDMRLYQAAAKFGLEHVVKINADDVAIQTKHIDLLIQKYYEAPSYHTLDPTQCPAGVSATVLPFWMLASAITHKSSNQSIEEFLNHKYGCNNVKDAGGYVLQRNDISLRFDSRHQISLLSRIFDELDRGVDLNDLIRELDEQS